MSISARLVSWPELVTAWKAHRDRRDFLFRAEDDNQPWVAYASVQDDSPRTALAASEVYERLRRHLGPAARRQFDELFGAFFWWNTAAGRNTPAYVQELSQEADGEVFAVAMKPDTVKKYLALWDEAAFEPLRRAFPTAFPRGTERIETFDSFKQYAEMWVGLLRRAAERDRGLVVSVFGT
jgi:hypothetical protein